MTEEEKKEERSRERAAWATLFTGLLFGAILGAVTANLWTTDSLYEKFTAEKVEEAKDRCCTHETRPCVFGPSIVGVQECGFDGHWSDTKCEPDPHYRVPDITVAP